MEEEQDPSPEYIKQFNNGYIMQKDEPELLKQILSIDNNKEELKALKAGKQQYEREQFNKEIERAKTKNRERER